MEHRCPSCFPWGGPPAAPSPRSGLSPSQTPAFPCHHCTGTPRGDAARCGPGVTLLAGPGSPPLARAALHPAQGTGLAQRPPRGASKPGGWEIPGLLTAWAAEAEFSAQQKCAQSPLQPAAPGPGPVLAASIPRRRAEQQAALPPNGVCWESPVHPTGNQHHGYTGGFARGGGAHPVALRRPRPLFSSHWSGRPLHIKRCRRHKAKRTGRR